MPTVYDYRAAGREFCNNTEGSQHYKGGTVEPLDLIFSKGHGAGFCLGSIEKYAGRFPETNDLNDLRKISDYAQLLCGFILLRTEANKAQLDNIETRAMETAPDMPWHLFHDRMPEAADANENGLILVEDLPGRRFAYHWNSACQSSNTLRAWQGYRL